MKAKGGDCYKVAGRLITTPEYEAGWLCHGSVYHPESGRHSHAWIETPARVGKVEIVICHDVANGNDVHLPQDAYYRLGKVEHVKRYTAEEATTLMLKTGKYGPWHEDEKGGKREDHYRANRIDHREDARR